MVKLNEKGYKHAKELISQGKVVKPENWEPPEAASENEYVDANGIEAFAMWHLGVDTEANEDTKGAWKFIFTSDFENVDRKGITAIRQRAAQFGYDDIFEAAGKLLEMIDAEQEKEATQELKQKTFSCETKQVEANVVDFVITTEDVDRMNERVIAAGCEFENYLKNPIVLFAHNWEMPIGKCLGLLFDENRIIARTQFFPDLIEDAKMKTAVNLALNGVLKAVSIGFLEKEVKYERIGNKDVRTITKWELVEYSVVSVPANPNAVAKTFSSLDEKAGRVISSENLSKLTRAIEAIEEGLSEIREVIQKAEPTTNIPTAEVAVEQEEKGEKEEQQKIKIISFFDFFNMFNKEGKQ